MNKWYKIWWRKLISAIRHKWYLLSFNKDIRRSMWDEIYLITYRSIERPLTEEEYQRVEYLHYRLGTGMAIYRFTPEERQRQNELAKSVIEQLKAEGKW
jgi:hypothetical protein